MSEKLTLLKNWFKNHKGTVTAFSGGVDSSLVLYVSNLVLRENAIGLISNSESLKSKDFVIASSFCENHNIKLEIIKTDELNDTNYTANPSNRCFFCKNHLYEAMIDLIRVKYPTFTIINGTNFDDLGDYRPGLEAANIHQIKSPLVELKITKKEVIEMANDTVYGLASYVYTRDISRAMRMFEALRFGIVGINDINPTAAAAPFGGMKESGLGREGGREGIAEYLETKLGGFSV